jgi:hypothetical protein
MLQRRSAGLPLLSSVLQRSRIIFGAESSKLYNHTLMDKLQGGIVWAPIFDYLLYFRMHWRANRFGKRKVHHSQYLSLPAWLSFSTIPFTQALGPLNLFFPSLRDAHATTRNTFVTFSRICGNLPSGPSLVSLSP